MNHFTLIINPGRSGSTFLYYLLKKNYSSTCYIAHEDIPPQISKPRIHNRAYEQAQIERILKDKKLMSFIKLWEKELKTRNVIETGWTSYHLAPFLSHFFGDKFRYVILHRDPLSFAFSRANMGFYHPKTFYTGDAHLISPFDKNTVAPQKKVEWSKMNHFEKCMFWWWVVYREAYEFREKNPTIPSLEIKSKDIFSYERLNQLLKFMDLDPAYFKDKNIPKNELPKFMRESFPIDDEWENYTQHEDILEFAGNLGYTFNSEKVKELSNKYKLPNSSWAKLRYSIGYWRRKSKVKEFGTQTVRRILQR